MDAKEYDRIADLLMQIRVKYKTLDSENEENAKKLRYVAHYVDQLLLLNHNIAELDAKGWL